MGRAENSAPDTTVLRLPIHVYSAESQAQGFPYRGTEVGFQEKDMLQVVGTLIDREQIARQWLANFSHVVQQRDFEAGRDLFADHVAAFGTIARIVCGLDRLEKQQWRKVWGNMRRCRRAGGPASAGKSRSSDRSDGARFRASAAVYSLASVPSNTTSAS